jgi:hypothetical protein
MITALEEYMNEAPKLERFVDTLETRLPILDFHTSEFWLAFAQIFKERNSMIETFEKKTEETYQDVWAGGSRVHSCGDYWAKIIGRNFFYTLRRDGILKEDEKQSFLEAMPPMCLLYAKDMPYASANVLRLVLKRWIECLTSLTNHTRFEDINSSFVHYGNKDYIFYESVRQYWFKDWPLDIEMEAKEKGISDAEFSQIKEAAETFNTLDNLPENKWLREVFHYIPSVMGPFRKGSILEAIKYFSKENGFGIAPLAVKEKRGEGK